MRLLRFLACLCVVRFWGLEKMWVGVVVVCSYRVSVRGWYIFVCISLFCVCVCVCFFKTIWEVFFSSVRAFFFFQLKKEAVKCVFEDLCFDILQRKMLYVRVYVSSHFLFSVHEKFFSSNIRSGDCLRWIKVVMKAKRDSCVCVRTALYFMILLFLACPSIFIFSV